MHSAWSCSRLELLKAGHPAHDAYDGINFVQIKMTGGHGIAMYASAERLVVLRVASPHEAQVVYDGPGQPAWDAAGKPGKTSQRVISPSRLRKTAVEAQSATVSPVATPSMRQP